MTILPSIADRWRNKRDGTKRYVGQVLMFDGATKTVIAEVYGSSLEQMRERKHAAYELFKEMYQPKRLSRKQTKGPTSAR